MKGSSYIFNLINSILLLKLASLVLNVKKKMSPSKKDYNLKNISADARSTKETKNVPKIYFWAESL